MIKVEHVDVWGFRHAIRGMRNPLDSWGRSDSYEEDGAFVLGNADLELARKLYKGGPEHRKYLRQIMVSMDITAPLYWWKEFDTYKVGTAANSCSTMHTLTKREIVPKDFSSEDFDLTDAYQFRQIVKWCEQYRQEFLRTGDTVYWRRLIQMLPQSYNQKRTVTFNYENAVNMIHQRENHKLSEWREFVEILKGLPYMAEITEGGEG